MNRVPSGTKESCFSAHIYAARERKGHKEKELCLCDLCVRLRLSSFERTRCAGNLGERAGAGGRGLKTGQWRSGLTPALPPGLNPF